MTEHNIAVNRRSILWPAAGSAESISNSVVGWDVDGTLSRSDTLIPFLSRVLGPAQLAQVVLDVARRVPPGRSWRAVGKATLLYAALAGRDVASVNAIARAYAARLVAGRLRPDSLRRWRWHRDQGHRLVLVSASPDLYIRHLGAILGADDVICTEMEVVNGWLTGRMRTPNCRGEEKARRLRGYLALRPGHPIWVYANGSSDLPALALADVPVRVRPFTFLRTPPDRCGPHALRRTGVQPFTRAE